MAFGAQAAVRNARKRAVKRRPAAGNLALMVVAGVISGA
jgi:hypothetical protein